MRLTFIFFILISVALHFLIIAQVDLTPPEKKKKDPVSVSIIEKKKPKPPEVKPEPEPKPEEPTKPPKEIREEDIPPLDEELETDINQLEAVPSERSHDKPKERKADKPGESAPVQPEESDTQPIEQQDEAPVELPKVEAPKKLTKEELEKILNSKRVIDKYAREGGTPDGEDYVSMQYVKIKYQSYFYKFSRRLYQVWAYPRQAAFRGEQGIVRISFTISRNGMISGINVIQSSGYPDLDKEAVMALKKTAGVPLPKSYELNFLKVDAYFQYTLNNRGYIIY